MSPIAHDKTVINIMMCRDKRLITHFEFLSHTLLSCCTAFHLCPSGGVGTGQVLDRERERERERERGREKPSEVYHRTYNNTGCYNKKL